MDLLDQLLGANGCSVEGTEIQNPVNAMVDGFLNSSAGISEEQERLNADIFSTGIVESDEHHSLGDEQAYMAQPTESFSELQDMWDSCARGDFDTDFFAAQSNARAQAMSSMEMQHRMMMMYSGFPMQLQVQHSHTKSSPARVILASLLQFAMGHQHAMAPMRTKQPEVLGPEHEVSTQIPATKVMKESAAEVVEDVAVLDSIDERTQALLESTQRSLLGGGSAGVEALEDIWKSFLSGQSDVDHDGASVEGYKQAWEALSQKLESLGDEDVYVFQDHNRYRDEEQVSDIELFEQGMEHFRQGRIGEAILAFEAQVQLSVGHDEGWRMLGVCHAENDDDKRAIQCLKKAIECDPYNLDALLQLGTSFVNELNPKGALESLRSWVSHNPKFQGLNVEPDAYSDGSLMDEVMQLMLAASAHAPADVDVQVVLGVLYNVSSDYASAAEQFEAALKERPTDYSLLNKLGATLANSSRSEEAVGHYASALGLRPSYARAWLNLGISYANLNQDAEAAQGYLQALRISPNAIHIWDYLRLVLSNMGRFDLVERTSDQNVDEIAAALGVELLAPPS